MSIANSRPTSRSFVDLSLLNCVRKIDSVDDYPDLEPDVMKDLRSFTGINCLYPAMAASPNGHHILFKTTEGSSGQLNTSLYLYDISDITKSSNIRICGIDICHTSDTIFNCAFLDERNVVLILNSQGKEYYLVKGILDLESKLLKIDTPVSPSHISSDKKHYKTCVTYDENGPVLISYPISCLNKAQSKLENPSTSTNAPVIELLHLRAFFDRRGVKPLLIHPVMRDRQGVFCDPFIYRNHLYLFDYFASTLICISMVGEGKGDVRLLNTYGDPIHQHPNLKYVHKCHLVFGDILLVYFYQHADRPDAEPQLWKLELGSMSWYKLQLSLSYHSPSQRVCLQQAAGQPFAYLHGECGRSDCAEKVHLYQLTLDISCVKPNLREKLAEFVEKTILPEKATAAVVEKSNDKVRRSLSNVDMHDTAPSTSSSNRSVTSSCLSKYLASESAKPPSLRYAMRRRNMEKKRRSSSVVAGSRTPLYGAGSTSQCPPEPSMHWSEEMSSETDVTSLSTQMKLAKDMGYTDEEITRAISMNSAGDGSYQPFSSPSAMIDMLSEVQKSSKNTATESSSSAHASNTGDSGLELDRSSYVSTSPPRTPAIGVRRTISFHTVSSAQAARHDSLTPSMYEMRYNRSNNFQLQRLLDAFDKERKSFIDESTKSIKMLEEQCRTESNTVKYLNTLMETKQMEIYTLKNKLDTQNEALNHTQSLLDIQVHESCSKAEELRSLQKKYDVFKERSLTETETNEKEIRELREKLSKAEDSLKTKQEECLSLRKDMARLTEVVTKQENELEQCKNFKAEIRKAEQRIEEMRIERDNVVSALNMIPTCVICLDRRPQVLYMPCSHFVCCESCGNRFENCPTCRQKICGKITVYQ